jgi:hypothetical protein
MNAGSEVMAWPGINRVSSDSFGGSVDLLMLANSRAENIELRIDWRIRASSNYRHKVSYSREKKESDLMFAIRQNIRRFASHHAPPPKAAPKLPFTQTENFNRALMLGSFCLLAPVFYKLTAPEEKATPPPTSLTKRVKYLLIGGGTASYNAMEAIKGTMVHDFIPRARRRSPDTDARERNLSALPPSAAFKASMGERYRDCRTGVF